MRAYFEGALAAFARNSTDGTLSLLDVGGVRNKVAPGMVRNKVVTAACKENSPGVVERIVLIVDDADDEHEIVAHWKCLICKYASNDRISDWCESCGRHFQHF